MDLTTLAAALDAEVERLGELAQQVRRLAARDDPEHSDGEACRLLKVAEVMEATGLARGTIYRISRAGGLGAVRVGARGVRFSARGVAEWIRDGGDGGSSAAHNSRTAPNG